MKSFALLFLVGALQTSSVLQAAIISVSVPQESQDYDNNDNYPARDNIWSAPAPPNPLETSLGIGHILNTSPSVLAYDIDPLTRLGVLHSHKYDAPYVPVSSAVVTFGFDTPTIVDQLEILQHFNGVTRVERFVGNDLLSLTSIGNVFGPSGNLTGSFIFTEGQSYVFDFDNTITGTWFQFRITQTSLVDGYALHRAFPRTSDGIRIEAVPEPSMLTLLSLGSVVIFRNRRRN